MLNVSQGPDQQTVGVSLGRYKLDAGPRHRVPSEWAS